MGDERRKLSRRDLSYYMRVMDEHTGKLVGHVSDISTGGFKLDSKYSVPLNIDLRLRIDQTGSISSKSFIVFTARAKWCQRDPFDPTMYNVGLQVMDMTPSDLDILVEMFNTYGTQKASSPQNNADYLWR